MTSGQSRGYQRGIVAGLITSLRNFYHLYVIFSNVHVEQAVLKDGSDVLLHERYHKHFPAESTLSFLMQLFCHHQSALRENLKAKALVVLNMQQVGRRHYFPCDLSGLTWKSDTKVNIHTCHL